MKDSNLQQHRLTHRRPAVKCLCCPRMFTTYSGMIIHLESGACPSQISESDLVLSAARIYDYADFFVYTDTRDQIENGDTFYLQEVREEYGNVDFFNCPTCKGQFPQLSSLFMHVATPACSQTMRGGIIGELRQVLFDNYA